MAYFLFIDESGQDRKEVPYEVLAGISVQDAALWNLVRDIQDIQVKYFGTYYKENQTELKAKKLLNRKTFRLANQLAPINAPSIPSLVQECFQLGPNVKEIHLTALGQAKTKYVEEILSVCRSYDCRIFASIIDYRALAAQPQLGDFASLSYLRKDYAYLFERYYYFLEDRPIREMGVVVFDEHEKSKSHILIDQVYRYFQKSTKGKERSELIIPEPLFVHSELTTGIHVADLVAYCLAWGFRTGELTEAKRDELAPYVDLICRMRYRASRVIPEIQSTPSDIWSVAIIRN